MSSQSQYTVGFGDERSSSRVLKPPGGGYSDIFGTEPEPPHRYGRRQACDIQANSAAEKQASEQSHKEQTEANSSEKSHVNEAPKETHVAQPQHSETDSQKPPEKPARTKSENTKAEPEKPADEPKQRVRVPPGGFSTGFW